MAPPKKSSDLTLFLSSPPLSMCASLSLEGGGGGGDGVVVT